MNPYLADDDGNTSLHFSASKGYLNIVKYLIEEVEVDPNQTNSDGNSPLMMSSMYNHFDMVKYLLVVAKVNPNCKDYWG